MKSFIQAAVTAALMYAPVAAFAQSNAPVTRAQVKTDLVQLEQAGYAPGRDQPDYPTGLQAAQARVQAQSGNSGSDSRSDSSGYGGSASHASQSGVRMAQPGDRSSIYFGD
jgi:hypothetical protein